MRINHAVLLSLSLTVLGGCKAIEAMDNTGDMKKDLAAMKAVTQGMAKTTGGMNKTTSDLEREAKVGNGVDWIEKDGVDQVYDPPSPRLMAGAKLVAENMTNDELAEYFYIKIKALKKAANDAEKKRDQVGDYPAAYVAKFNRDKQFSIVALQAIAAQIPQSETEIYTDEQGNKQTRKRLTASVEALLREQVLGDGGRHKTSMLVMLMLRAKFLNEFFLDSGVFGEPMTTYGLLDKAFEYTSNLQFIASLPFADQIKFITPEGTFLPPVQPAQKGEQDEECSTPDKRRQNAVCQETLGTPISYNEVLDVNIAKSWWKKIARRIDNDLPDTVKNGARARDIEEKKQVSLRNAEDGAAKQ